MSFYADERASDARSYCCTVSTPPLRAMKCVPCSSISGEIGRYSPSTCPVSASEARSGYSPDVFVQAILDFVGRGSCGMGPVDVMALSLTSEFAAIAAVEQPDAFRS